MERGDYDGDNDGILFSVLLLVDIIFGALMMLFFVCLSWILKIAKWMRLESSPSDGTMEPPSLDGAIGAAIVGWCD